MNKVLNPPQGEVAEMVLAHGSRSKVIAVTSGRGGVGKTFVSANLASSLVERGLRVLVLDADLGLANLDVVLNLCHKITLHHVIAGKSRLEEAIYKAPGGFSVLLAGTGTVEFSRLASEVHDEFLRIVESLLPNYDIVLLDTGAGISEVVQFSLSMASEILLVVTPEPTSLTDAYATIKVLAAQQKLQKLHVVVNQAVQTVDGNVFTTKLQQVLDRFVNKDSEHPLKLIHMGDIPVDSAVRQAIMKRQLLAQSAPGCPAALAIAQLASKLEDAVIKHGA
ncbi:MAG: MinD/ParA family protein [Gammaproteobacteria bacterium]|nr:MinD/ParA family protein [Gammaproteobacteria bacterium]